MLFSAEAKDGSFGAVASLCPGDASCTLGATVVNASSTISADRACCALSACNLSYSSSRSFSRAVSSSGIVAGARELFEIQHVRFHDLVVVGAPAHAIHAGKDLARGCCCCVDASSRR